MKWFVYGVLLIGIIIMGSVITAEMEIGLEDDSVPHVKLESATTTSIGDYGYNQTYPHVNSTWDYNQTEAASVFDYNQSYPFVNGTYDYNQTREGDGEYILVNGTSYYFNTSTLSTTYYNTTQAGAVTGTITGTIDLTQHQDGNYDSYTLNITEAAGSPGLDVRMNFTSIDDFNGGVIRYYTSNLVGEYPVIQLWDYISGTWEDYPLLGETSTYKFVEQPVYDADDHLSGGVVQMRLYKASTGNINNKYYVDWVAISKGLGTPAGEEVDPYALHRDGSTPMLGNLNMSNFTLTDLGNLLFYGNITPQINKSSNLGSETNWFKNIFSEKIKASNISADWTNSTNIDSINLDTENATINRILSDGSDDVVVVLTP